MGRKNRPFYRLIAIDSKKRREGLEIERLGWYNPLKEEFSYKINEERILYWMKKGAQASDATKGIFKRSGLSYKWHLISQGVKDTDIDSLMEEWKKNQLNREQAKTERKKIKKTEASIKTDSEKSEDSAGEEVVAEAVAEETVSQEPAAEEVAEEPASEEPATEEVGEEPASEELDKEKQDDNKKKVKNKSSDKSKDKK